MKYIIIIYLLVAGSSCKQEEKADQDTQKNPDIIKFDDLNVLKEEQLKKLTGLKELLAKTMVEYFGEPIDFGESYDDSCPDPFADPDDDPQDDHFAEFKSPNLTRYAYSIHNEGMYIFEVKEGTYSPENLEKVVISSVTRQPEGKVIWRSEEELKKQEKLKKQGLQEE